VVGAWVIHLADAAKVNVTAGALDVIAARIVAMGRPGSCRVAASYWTIVSYHVLLTHFRGCDFECCTASGFLGAGGMSGRTRVEKILEDTGEMVQKSADKVYALTLQAVVNFDNSLVVEAQ
jgi:hypothetical protein